MADLSKWTTMVVVGNAVTAEQANEILVRTMAREYFDQTNDRSWAALIREVIGVDSEDRYHPGEDWDITAAKLDKQEARLDELGVLHLEFLYNSRITSAYIGGPHGWMNWDGQITGNTPYNVGKWPNEVELLNEWKLIASAFPFLNLTAQFHNEVPDENGFLPLDLEVTVRDGVAEITSGAAFPEDLISYQSPSTEALFANFMYCNERGVSEERLRAAVAQVEELRNL